MNLENIRKTAFTLLATLMIYSCSKSEAPQLEIIPMPNSIEFTGGEYTLNKDISPKIIIDSTYKNGTEEGYKLTVNKSGIEITAATEKGAFYGQKTLEQLTINGKVPYVNIEDEPRFKYRGLHLDVSRHFRDKEFVIKLINELSRYKINTLHLHLTDGTGWRLKIDKYPKLTSETAFRTYDNWQDWTNSDNKDARKFVTEGKGGHGGYYTKEDIREILKVAENNQITVIPEIEMPGHSEEVFVAYPELSCSGVPYKNSDFCVGNEATFEFVEGVLDEVINLFPSKYIHIGGDEAGKGAWKTCPKCQKRMKDNNLADVDELQSYMIKRVEKYIQSKGRKLIGWDEIIEGGLSDDATVMSWRGESGGIKAAKQGNDVIMTPGNSLYFDFYQADPTTQPKAIGGYTTLKKVYDYNPIPAEIDEKDAKHILGAQANLWTEYVPTEEHAEYMIFPRVLAVAEMTWTNQDKREWNDFKIRANAHIPKLKARGINTFELSYDLEPSMSVDSTAQTLSITLESERYPAEIRYSLNGEAPTVNSPLYEAPIVVKDSAKLYAAIFENGKLMGKGFQQNYDYHKAAGKKVEYLSKLYSGYMAGGEGALTDVYNGSFTYLDGRWQGYTNSLECIIDMETVQAITKVSARFMEIKGPGVFLPGDFEVLTSVDGKEFTSQGIVKAMSTDGMKEPIFETYTINFDTKARYIKVKASEVHNHAFIFVDEIIVW